MYHGTGVSLQQMGMAEAIRGRQNYGFRLSPTEDDIINDIIHFHDDTNPNIENPAFNALRNKYKDRGVTGIHRYDFDPDVQLDLQAIITNHEGYLDNSVSAEMARDSYERLIIYPDRHVEPYNWQETEIINNLNTELRNKQMKLAENSLQIDEARRELQRNFEQLAHRGANLEGFEKVFKLPDLTLDPAFPPLDLSINFERLRAR